MTYLTLRDDFEYAVHCDEKGEIIGPISKTHAHLLSVRTTLTHYSTWSMIFYPISGKYGLQLKNPKILDGFTAGKWDMGAAGHNCYIKDKKSYRPMSFEETLIKEVDEEIGLDIDVIDSLEKFIKMSKESLKKPIAFFFDKFHYKTERNNEFVGLAFILTPTTNVKFKDNEVVQFKWLTPEELSVFIKKEKNYCDPLTLVFEKAEIFRKKNLE